MRPIDADALLQSFNKKEYGFSSFEYYVKQAPTIDPVRHGKWMSAEEHEMMYGYAQQGWQCPLCGRVYSPTTLMCYYCGGQTKTTTHTGAILNFNSEIFEQMIKNAEENKDEEGNVIGSNYNNQT